MSVDAHIHFWRLSRGDNLALLPSMARIYRDLEPLDLKPHIDAAGVERIVVVQGAETLAETLFTLGLAARFPWIAGVVGWVDLASPSVFEELAALTANPRLKGIRPVRNDNQSIAWMLDRRLEPGWRVLQQAKMVVDILVQNPDELSLVAHLVRTHRDISFVLDHCAKPDIAHGRFEPWASDFRELARFENVVCKLSGLLNCAAPGAGPSDVNPYVEHVLGSFGSRRVLWASDWPPLELAASYAEWRRVSLELLEDHLSAEDRPLVLGGNAERIYQLGANGGLQAR